MSQKLISLNADLKKLRDNGFEIEVRGTYLLVHHVPYVTGDKVVAYGTLVSDLVLVNDKTAPPKPHTIYFIGEYPCNKQGNPIKVLEHNNGTKTLMDNLIVDRSFSSKIVENGAKRDYRDYFEKIVTYVGIISASAKAIDPKATARTYKVIIDDDEDSVFEYFDTASSRAEISAITQKLAVEKVAVIGLGGSGSYTLDQMAKIPVKEIHLFDGDVFHQHNAFRSPGAISAKDLEKQPKKVQYFKGVYSKMHKGIKAHPYHVVKSNLSELDEMSFIFIAIDNGEAKKVIVDYLIERQIPFIDVGMGVNINEEDLSIYGQVRVTAGAAENYDHIGKKIDFSAEESDNEYNRNVQIADLNALNAILAVTQWKRMRGFYWNNDFNYSNVFVISANEIINGDTVDASGNQV